MACPPWNPAEALPARSLLPFQPDFFLLGVWNGLSTFKPRRSTSSPISSFRGFGMACPPSNPAQSRPACFSFARSWKCLTTFPDRKRRRHLHALRRITDYISDYGFDCLGFLTPIPGLRIKVRPAGIWYRPVLQIRRPPSNSSQPHSMHLERGIHITQSGTYISSSGLSHSTRHHFRPLDTW